MILVTGASGFVGSHLMATLAERGVPAIGASRTSVQGLHRIDSFDHPSTWRELLDGVDTVIHCAARAHILRETSSNPLAAFRQSNRDFSLHLAQQAKQAGVRRFVFLSSLGVHGSATFEGKPFTANDRVDPQTDYACSKAEAEEVLKSFANDTGLELVIIRPPLVYGPGVSANFLRLMKLVDSGIPSIFAAVDNRRSYVYIENLCDFILNAAVSSRAVGQTFLVSDGEDVSTDRLYRDLARLMGKRSYGLRVPENMLKVIGSLTGTLQIMQQLTGCLQADITASSERLGWMPPFPYEEGLARTVAAYKALKTLG